MVAGSSNAFLAEVAAGISFETSPPGPEGPDVPLLSGNELLCTFPVEDLGGPDPGGPGIFFAGGRECQSVT